MKADTPVGSGQVVGVLYWLGQSTWTELNQQNTAPRPTLIHMHALIHMNHRWLQAAHCQAQHPPPRPHASHPMLRHMHPHANTHSPPTCTTGSSGGSSVRTVRRSTSPRSAPWPRANSAACHNSSRRRRAQPTMPRTWRGKTFLFGLLVMQEVISIRSMVLGSQRGQHLLHHRPRTANTQSHSC